MTSNRRWVNGVLVAVGALSSTAALDTASATPHRDRATASPASNYCDPLGGCRSLKASPGKVKPGQTVRLYGTVGTSCKVPATVTIASTAFAGATRHRFKGVPSVTAQAGKSRFFSTKLRIRKARKGTYTVQGRCGKSNFAKAKLRVT
jgi:hypothetical protein